MSTHITVEKFDLVQGDLQEIAMPIGSEILSVAKLKGNLCLFAAVPVADHNLADHNENPPLEIRKIVILFTKHIIPERKRRFIGTVVIEPYVCHVFEDLE